MQIGEANVKKNHFTIVYTLASVQGLSDTNEEKPYTLLEVTPLSIDVPPMYTA